ncbi:MAG TPA: hypothetical protein VGR43_07005 [Dehalococcoidia bacterium]|jgi:hypothetical protein|nr:hypothetical protein [Dehalococcoidia bacterium]
MDLIANELQFKARIMDREREIRNMPRGLRRPTAPAIRAVVAAHLAQLAVRIDHDAAGRATGVRAVDFADSGSS